MTARSHRIRWLENRGSPLRRLLESVASAEVGRQTKKQHERYDRRKATAVFVDPTGFDVLLTEEASVNHGLLDLSAHWRASVLPLQEYAYP